MLLLCAFICFSFLSPFFFFTVTSTTEIYTLSLHDALPILEIFPRQHFPLNEKVVIQDRGRGGQQKILFIQFVAHGEARSEEHTSELQSRPHLVCRLLLEKKKNT